MGVYVHFAKNQGDFRGSKNINFSKSPPIWIDIIFIKRGDLLKNCIFGATYICTFLQEYYFSKGSSFDEKIWPNTLDCTDLN